VIECRLTHLIDEIRIYHDHDGYVEKADYLAIVTVVWLSDIKVMLRGAKGEFSKRSFLALLRTLRKAGALTAVMTRTKGKRMPFAKLVEGGEYENTWEIKLEECT
jgi:hypothetical protein